MKTPKQERGRKRVDKILDAASLVFAEVGYEAATTILIAERAETAVGSLYQFFPNKEAIAQALVARYVAAWQAQAESINLEAFPALTAQEMGDQFVEPLREFIRYNRDFQVLFASATTSKELAAMIRPVDEMMLARGGAALAVMRPDLSAAERRRYGLIGMYIIKGLLAAVAFSDELDLDTVFDEMKVVLSRYMESIIQAGVEPRRGRRGK